MILLVFLLAGGCTDAADAVAAGDAGTGGALGNGAGGNAGDGDGSGDGSGSGSGSNDGSATSGAPTFYPAFPGAGTSGAGEPLQNGQLCDYEPGEGELPTQDEVTTCFFDQNGNHVPAATLEQVLECVEGTDVVHLRLTFDPSFVDNTYGDNSIGWSPKRGHRFRDLTGSDHAELLVKDGDGNVVLQFKLDYIEEDASAPSGYASGGVTGGDGELSVGEQSWIVNYSTSLDRNLNARGYGEYTEHSPATDENFTPNPDTPEWDYRMVYEAWIDVAALGDAGFGGAFIEYVHASPAKADNDTIEVTPGECPPDFCTNPDGCYANPPPGEDCGDQPDDNCGGEPPPPPTNEEECGDQPDDYCGGEADPPPGEDEPSFCEQYPNDPICKPQ